MARVFSIEMENLDVGNKQEKEEEEQAEKCFVSLGSEGVSYEIWKLDHVRAPSYLQVLGERLGRLSKCISGLHLT